MIDSLFSSLEVAEGDPPGLHRDCQRCNRPRKSSCVCHALPAEKLDSKATLIVLQHPFEVRRRLATVPLLSAALRKATVPRGRRFGGELCPPSLSEAMDRAEREKIPVLLMFPGPDALDVKEVAERGIPTSVFQGEGGDGGGGREGDGEEEKEAPLAFPPVRGREYILVAVDGTWKQGVQMFRDLAPWFLAPRGPAVRVQLPIGDKAEELREMAAEAFSRASEDGEDASAVGDGEDSAPTTAGAPPRPPPTPPPPPPSSAVDDVTRNICSETKTIALFKEPFEGCCTTAEAIARALAVLEPTPAPAAAVLAALNAVVDSQKLHDPAVRARCGLDPGEGNAERGGESWHRRLHERRERKRLEREEREAAGGKGSADGVSSSSAVGGERPPRRGGRNTCASSRDESDAFRDPGRPRSVGLADSRRKFGFKNPPSNDLRELRGQRPPLNEEEKKARKEERLAARIALRKEREEREGREREAQAVPAAVVAAAKG